MVIPRSRSALSLSKTQANREGGFSLGSCQPNAEIALTVLEGTLSELGGFLLELLNSTFVDTTALVDQVTSGGRFSRVDVTNDWERDRIDARNDSAGALTDDINVDLFFTHSGFLDKGSVSIVDDGERECISSTIQPQIRRRGRTSRYFRRKRTPWVSRREEEQPTFL